MSLASKGAARSQRKILDVSSDDEPEHTQTVLRRNSDGIPSSSERAPTHSGYHVEPHASNSDHEDKPPRSSASSQSYGSAHEYWEAENEQAQGEREQMQNFLNKDREQHNLFLSTVKSLEDEIQGLEKEKEHMKEFLQELQEENKTLKVLLRSVDQFAQHLRQQYLVFEKGAYI